MACMHSKIASSAENVERVKSNATATTRVGVIGMGYVGLPLALLFSSEGFQVTGFDIDSTKITTLNAGRSYIYRIAGEEIRAAQQRGFTATAEYSAISDVDAIVICVPTPLNDNREPDLSFI